MKMPLFVGLAVLTLLCTVPTAAVMLHDEPVESVSLEASSSYASIENGALTLDFERLNKRAVTEVDHVFSITIADDNVDRVWISNDVEGITFYGGGDSSAEIDAANPLEPSASKTTSIGVAVDTNRARSGTETFRIHVAYEDENEEEDEEDEEDGENEDVHESDTTGLEQTAINATPTTVAPGEPVTVNATYENSGNETAEGTVRLTVDGVLADAESIELEPNETTTVTFKWTPDAAGTYVLAVDDVRAGTITVEDPSQSLFSLEPRELSATTTALAPPTALGLLSLASFVSRRRQ